MVEVAEKKAPVDTSLVETKGGSLYVHSDGSIKPYPEQVTQVSGTEKVLQTTKTTADVGSGVSPIAEQYLPKVDGLLKGTKEAAPVIEGAAMGESKLIGTAAESVGIFGKAGKFFGRIATPLMAIAGTAETGIALKQKKGHQAAKAAGGTIGGIGGGMAAAAIIGALIPGGIVVELIIGAVGALFGAWGGSKVADKAGGKQLDAWLHRNDKPSQTPLAKVNTLSVGTDGFLTNESDIAQTRQGKPAIGPHTSRVINEKAAKILSEKEAVLTGGAHI